MTELQAIFAGRVQGVGFRVTMRAIALKLGIQGTVRNLPNGTVELYAQASREILEELVSSIQREFPASRPDSLIYSKITKTFSHFNIIE